MLPSDTAATPAQGPRRVRQRRVRNGRFGVKGQLTVKTPRETTEVIAAARRLMVASSRRVGSGDIDCLAELANLQDIARGLTALAIERLRQDQGVSWAEVALRLGVTRQAAQQRYGKGER